MAAKLETTLARLLESRRSLRELAPRPLRLEELGALLHAAARVQEVRRDHRRGEDISLPPHADGSARHPFGDDISPGQCLPGPGERGYRYDPLSYALERIPSDPALVEELLAQNPRHLEGPHPPQVSLYLAARIGKIA